MITVSANRGICSLLNSDVRGVARIIVYYQSIINSRLWHGYCIKHLFYVIAHKNHYFNNKYMNRFLLRTLQNCVPVIINLPFIVVRGQDAVKRTKHEAVRQTNNDVNTSVNDAGK